MDRSLIEGIVSELSCVSPLEDAKPAEVTRSQVIERAKWMTERKGYVHGPETVEALCYWMKGYGLILRGGVGCGKTSFFRCLGEERMRFWSPLVNMSRKLEDIEEEIDAMRAYELVVDDVGAEPVYNNFGVRLDIIPWVVEKRMYVGSRTHFTTNLTNEELLRRYGARVTNRMHELAKVIEIPGGPKRRTRIFKVNTNK